MITTAILTILFYAIDLLLMPLKLFADATISPNITTAITSASNSLALLDVIIPIGTLIAVIGAFLTIETFIFTYKLIMWAIAKIPMIN